MIVVDTNLLVYLLLPNPNQELAEAVFLKDSNWVAPPLIHCEFRNVLLGYVRRNGISANDADFLLDKAEEVVTTKNIRVNGKEVMELALQSGCTAYDSEFVWLAMDLGITFVSNDKKILRSFPQRCVTPKSFSGTLFGDS